MLNCIVKICICISLWINYSKEKHKKKEKQFFEARKTVTDVNSSKIEKGRFSVANFFKGEKGDKNPFKKQDL